MSEYQIIQWRKIEAWLRAERRARRQRHDSRRFQEALHVA